MSTTEVHTVSPDVADSIENIPKTPKNLLICRACGHPLADADDIYSIGGESEHERVNPYGVTYQFRCFANALGCGIAGLPTAADTWFMGYTWRLAICGNCEIHLGWLFESLDSFYGLLNRRTLFAENQDYDV